MCQYVLTFFKLYIIFNVCAVSVTCFLNMMLVCFYTYIASKQLIVCKIVIMVNVDKAVDLKTDFK